MKGGGITCMPISTASKRSASTARNLQARLEPAVVSELDEDRMATHGWPSDSS